MTCGGGDEVAWPQEPTTNDGKVTVTIRDGVEITVLKMNMPLYFNIWGIEVIWIIDERRGAGGNPRFHMFGHL